jgi:hypothetical protein
VTVDRVLPASNIQAPVSSAYTPVQLQALHLPHKPEQMRDPSSQSRTSSHELGRESPSKALDGPRQGSQAEGPATFKRLIAGAPLFLTV